MRPAGETLLQILMGVHEQEVNPEAGKSSQCVSRENNWHWFVSATSLLLQPLLSSSFTFIGIKLAGLINGKYYIYIHSQLTSASASRLWEYLKRKKVKVTGTLRLRCRPAEVSWGRRLREVNSYNL